VALVARRVAASALPPRVSWRAKVRECFSVRGMKHTPRKRAQKIHEETGANVAGIAADVTTARRLKAL